MRKIALNLTFTAFDAGEDMDPSDTMLLEQAVSASKQAYSPYSGFSVGAAVLLDNGEIIRANNQENVAYPSGLCAERVALFSAHANYPENKVVAIAITAETARFTLQEPVYPCGSCRQVMVELEDKQNTPIRVLMGGPGGSAVVADAAADLLPLQFSASLKKK